MAQHGIPFFSFIYLGTFTHGVCHSIIVPLPSSGFNYNLYAINYNFMVNLYGSKVP